MTDQSATAINAASASGAFVMATDGPDFSDGGESGSRVPLANQAAPAALAVAITKWLADEGARQRMSCRALARSAYFDWEESASAVLRAAQRAVRASRPTIRIQAPTGAGRPVASLPIAAAGSRGTS